MDMQEIIKNSIIYPFSDWKKILILGLIVLIYRISPNILPFNIHNGFTYPVLFIALFINCFILGYFYKLIQSSLKNTNELPKFSNWIILFKNGFKVTFVGLIYSLPATLPFILLTSYLFNFYSYLPDFISIIVIAMAHGHIYSVWFFVNSFLLLNTLTTIFNSNS